MSFELSNKLCYNNMNHSCMNCCVQGDELSNITVDIVSCVHSLRIHSINSRITWSDKYDVEMNTEISERY